MLSIYSKAGTTYPREGSFSPSERYPEYVFDHVSSQPNLTYGAVRECLAQAGLDREHFNTPSWNPLGQWIQRGQSVFVLPNFVTHRQRFESEERFAAKCTHGAVLRALVDYILLAVGDSGRVVFGNAPIQSCHWRSVLADTGADKVKDFYRARARSVQARDLRSYVSETDLFGAVKAEETREAGRSVEFDLGAKSLLSRLSAAAGSARFRVTDYDPRGTESFHVDEKHLYMIHRDVLDADVVVSLPKLKTHEKVGITCALKGFIGTITHKNCLAHHRFGTPQMGGDEYPSDSLHLKRTFSSLHDSAQMTSVRSFRGRWLRVVDRFARTLLYRVSPIQAGSWWGNDTAWRMALDVARIMRYGTAEGRMQNHPVRRHLVLVDGIVGGEGPGPLKPSPVPSGLLLLADDPVVADFACAALMGFDPQKINMLKESIQLDEFPLVTGDFQFPEVVLDGQWLAFAALPPLVTRPYVPPPGWRGHVEAPKATMPSAA